VKLLVNGETTLVDDDVTVGALATSILDRPKGVAVAVNGEVVPRSEWATTRLCNDDRVEVVTARQGG
jgi:sulfur carrier protein